MKEERGVWYFDITDEGETGKALKTGAAKRRVPAHSHLVELGFLAYLKRMKRTKQVRLFPTAEKSKEWVG